VTLLYTVGYEEAHFRRVFIIRGSLDGHHNNDLSRETLKLGPATIVAFDIGLPVYDNSISEII